jgi:hypothetical protein
MYYKKRQLHVMKELNKKLATENATIARTDKGKNYSGYKLKKICRKSALIP